MITVSFPLYDQSGFIKQFQITGETPGEFIDALEDTLRLLQDRGFGDVAPDPSLTPRTEHIIGYVRGEANTRTKGESQQCVYLFNDIDAFTFKALTVYQDQIRLLPLGDLPNQKVWAGEPGAAPLRATAKQRGFFYPCDFTVLLAPKMDFKTKTPMVKVNGKGESVIQYYFVRVLKVHNYPYRSFENPVDAVAWGVASGTFLTSSEAQGAYDALKLRLKPPTSTDMWAAWIALVNNKLEGEL